MTCPYLTEPFGGITALLAAWISLQADFRP